MNLIKNLPAALRRAAHSPKLLLGFLTALGLVFMVNGCALAPAAVDRFIFVPVTNSVPVVTNYVTTVTATNTAGDVETRNIVTWLTNIETTVTYTVSTNAAALIQTGGNVGDIFAPGWGSIAASGLLGLLALWAKLRANKINAGAEVLTQTVETLLAILEQTKGKQFTDALKLRLVKDQNAAGVLREIALLVENTVDNDAAKALAKLLLEQLPQEKAS